MTRCGTVFLTHIQPPTKMLLAIKCWYFLFPVLMARKFGPTFPRKACATLEQGCGFRLWQALRFVEKLHCPVQLGEECIRKEIQLVFSCHPQVPCGNAPVSRPAIHFAASNVPAICTGPSAHTAFACILLCIPLLFTSKTKSRNLATLVACKLWKLQKLFAWEPC